MSTAFDAISARLATSLSVSSATRIFAFEGDSRSGPSQWPGSWTPSPVAIGVAKSISGSDIVALENRLPEMTMMAASKRSGDRLYGALLFGVNGLSTYPGATDTIAATDYAARIAAYCDNLYAGGFDKVILCTEIASTLAGHNTRRAILNNIYRTAYPGSNPVVICDMGADAIMGDDNSFANNPTYWTDGTHPNATGSAQLASIFAPVANALT